MYILSTIKVVLSRVDSTIHPSSIIILPNTFFFQVEIKYNLKYHERLPK